MIQQVFLTLGSLTKKIKKIKKEQKEEKQNHPKAIKKPREGHNYVMYVLNKGLFSLFRRSYCDVLQLNDLKACHSFIITERKPHKSSWRRCSDVELL